MCYSIGRSGEAEFLYRRAVGIARRTLDPSHPGIAASLQNLADLYRAQGETEKLARVADGRSPRSGLPDTGPAREADDHPEGTGGEAPDEIPEFPSTAARGQQDEPPSRRPQPLHRWPVPPAALAAGVALALLSILWLVFGGNTGGGAPGQERAGIGASVLAQHNAPDSVDSPSVERPPSRESDASLNRDNFAVGAAELGRVAPAAPAPEDRTTRVREPSWVVAAAEICRQLETRDADGGLLADWRCDPAADPAATGPVYFYMRIRSRTRTTVAHRWLRDGRIEQEVALDVEANDGPGFRTYSVRTVSPRERGAWRVELRSMEGELYHVEEFIVG